MSISDLPVLSALRTKMQWQQARQRVLSENVSNANTPNFKPRDLVEPKFGPAGTQTGAMGSLAMMRTSASHIALRRRQRKLRHQQQGRLPDQTAGNAVSLEEEMMKVSANQMDYAAVTSLYSKSLHLLKTAIGKG